MRLLASILVSVALLATGPTPAVGDGARAKPLEARKKKVKGTKASCLRALKALGVEYRRVERRGLSIGVRIRGPLGGVTYRSYDKRPLVVDCSLAVSLAAAGRFLTEHGIESATYSSAFQKRNIRGTRRRSQHSYGLAIDVHTMTGEESGSLSVREDYEQGLGDAIDCIGQPMTQAGAVLRAVACQLDRSGLFRTILDPDYDAGHYNHFHIEVRPWRDREDTDSDWARMRP